MENSDTNALESMDNAKNYNNYVYKKILKNLSPGKTLDFGAGYGTFSKLFIDSGVQVTALEVDNEAISILKKANIETIDDLNNYNNYFNNVISINVLEHIENDEDTINLLFQSLKHHGNLILYLPASMLAWSYIDEWVNHKRRYEKQELIKKVEKAGFEILKIEFVDFTGWVGVLVLKLLRYKPLLNQSKVAIYDKYIFNPFKFMDSIFKNIIGKNLFLVAKKVKDV